MGHALGLGLRGAGGTQGFKNYSVFKHGHVAYQIDGDHEQNRMQVKFSSYGRTGDLVVRSKGQILLNLVTMSISKIFIPNFAHVLTNKRQKTY